MQYEIYVDSLFLMNLGLNLYLLELANLILHHTATWKRIVMGALVGSVISIGLFWMPLTFFPASVIGFFLELICMSMITFQVSSPKAYIHIIEILSVLTLLMGSLLQHVLRIIPGKNHLPILIFLLCGGVCFLIVHRFLSRAEKNYECKVVLQGTRAKMKINALVDTGNNLIEPISGTPVAVLDKRVFECLFLDEKPAGFRVIPYRSIDQRAGLLPGYLLPEMKIEWRGICRDLKNVYVGVSGEGMVDTQNYKMIINPKLLKERNAG